MPDTTEAQRLAKLQAEILEAQHESAMLQLEETREQNAILKSQRASKKRQNASRQAQFRNEVDGRVATANDCSHRQGGTPSNPRRGKGATTLKEIKMPDGFTRVITCHGCRLRVFTPYPADMATKPRGDETPADASARVRKYKADLKLFEKLHAQMVNGALTEEMAAPMDTGNTVETRNTETGEITIRRSPFSSQLLQMDSSNLVIA